MSKRKNYGKSKNNKKKRNGNTGHYPGVSVFPNMTAIHKEAEIVKDGVTVENDNADYDFKNNLDFAETKTIKGRVIKDNGLLKQLVSNIKEDLRYRGKVAPYYFNHATVHQLMAIDKESDFKAEMERTGSHCKSQGVEYGTETIVFEDLEINGFKIKRLEMKNFIAMGGISPDPMAFQFGITHFCEVNSYLKMVA